MRGKDELKPNEGKNLAEIPTLDLLWYDDPHARCYANEGTCVVTSMNMCESSEVNNREMGVKFTRTSDRALYDDAMTEALAIVQSSDATRVAPAKPLSDRPLQHRPRGSCI